MLLQVRVANHRSIRDETALLLISTDFGGAVPLDGDWVRVTNRVTAIYGPNGSGKSTALSVIDFLRTALRNSATQWADREYFPYEPFELDTESRQRPSLYEIDFVEEDVRYTYGFESSHAGIHAEWLYTYPTGRRRTLFRRNDAEFSFGRYFAGETQLLAKMTGRTALLLSVGANAKNELLLRIQQFLVRHLLYVRSDEWDREARLNWLNDLLVKDTVLRKCTQSLISLADLGIAGISVRHRGIADRRAQSSSEHMQGLGFEEIASGDNEAARTFERDQVELSHLTDRGSDARPLPLSRESSGTVAWLSLVVPALHAIRHGLALLIDELDASLHPRLSATIIALFKDSSINTLGGQLVFTSHDTSLLGRRIGDLLKRDQIWFTEKDPSGSTALYALEEFSVRAADNIEKRYLDGRYGALPMIELDGLRQALGGEHLTVQP